MEQSETAERQNMQADIVCVGFGPAVAAFLTTLSRSLVDENGTPVLESAFMPGMPLQVICYERADGIGFGVSGVVTRATGIRESFPNLNDQQIPMACPVKHEKVLYLLDPIGASRRGKTLRWADCVLKWFKSIKNDKNFAVELPYIPPFLKKEGGFVLSMGQFTEWAGNQIMSQGTIQIWPGMPVDTPIIRDGKVEGVRLVDQGTDKAGKPAANFMPGMDVHAPLVVVGDGPVGSVGQALDRHYGLPEGHHQRDWAVGMKMLVELPEDCPLEAGTVLHTLGYPEPEIFGFLYVYPERKASLGIFVPSWFDSPVRTSYRYLQHWMLHPYLWRFLKGGILRSWGAKTLQESGKRGEPYLVGDGFARIGEGSGSTNVLTGSGVDEAWTTGIQLAEAVLELAKEKRPWSKENLEKTYVKRRRESRLQSELDIAEKSRDGFQNGFLRGLLGMALTGMTNGKINFPGKVKRPYERIPSLEAYYKGRISRREIEDIKKDCQAKDSLLHHALMERCGWPKIEYDGKLLMSHQDALLVGGKVQAPEGYADHVVFFDMGLCQTCENKICAEICSGQAITRGSGGVPLFDREKCIHCGACFWSCAKAHPENPERSNIEFRAGTGGLHSAEN